MNRIHESLHHAFLSHRILVWYDAVGEWSESVDSFDTGEVEILKVAENPFGTKVRVLSDPNPNQKFLLYVRNERPEEPQNWLLDLELQGQLFKADPVSLAVQEAGMRYEYRGLVERYLPFFKSRERVEAFKDRWQGDEEERVALLHLMGVYAGTPSDVDSILRVFATRVQAEPMFDPVTETFKAGDLPEMFWREVERLFGYQAMEPSVSDFMVFLFRSANPLDPNLKLNGHATVFLKQWQDSREHRACFEAWARRLEKELNITELIESTGSIEKIGTHDLFEAFDRFVLHRSCAEFIEEGSNQIGLRGRLEGRENGFWVRPDVEEGSGHYHGYQAVLSACGLREALEAVELSASSLDEAVKRYRHSWFRVDQLYRNYCAHADAYSHPSVLKNVTDWVERNYLNRFLLPLSDVWSDALSRQSDWLRAGDLPAQQDFFERNIRPILRKEQKALVIISDALRYEAGEELAVRLRFRNRITVEVEALMGTCPGYTQLGMAALLPGGDMEVDAESGLVKKGGLPTSGVENRSALLGNALFGRGCALQAEKFLSMHSHREGRPLMKDHDVVYVYHNRIDKVGDDRHTEAETPQAVEEAFDELERMIVKAFNINFTHVWVTADHGFLYQHDPVSDQDVTPIPKTATVTNKNRRFLLGAGFSQEDGLVIRSAEALGFEGDWECAFPRDLSRFPLKGSGKRYVHGGLTPQEMLVPALRVHKKRSDDQEKVTVEILRLPAKITTGQLAVALYQTEPVDPKRMGRRLELQLRGADGVAISDRQEVSCESESDEPRKREVSVVLTLSRKADSYNNQDVDLVISELRPGSQEAVPFRSERIRLQKSYSTDFDDF